MLQIMLKLLQNIRSLFNIVARAVEWIVQKIVVAFICIMLTGKVLTTREVICEFFV